MTCDFAAQLQQYHDGELAPESAARFEAHLAAGCAACAAELKSLHSVSNFFAINRSTIELPGGFLNRLHEEVDRTSAYSLLPLARSLVGVAAAVLIVASAGLWRFQSNEHASAPQAWEGVVFATPNDSGQSASQSAGTSIEPELIVADLSRSNGR